SIDFDAQALARACDRDVLALVPTHLGGRVADVAAAVALAHAAGAFVIEDAAQAFGARRGRVAVGLDGDAGLCSLAVGPARPAHAPGPLGIEDAAPACGARRGRVSAGRAGDAGFFSLAVGKGLTTYEGGLLVSADASLRRELRRTSLEIVPWRPAWELRR